MPKRSNAFQRLVYHLHKQLSPDAIVTESKLLIDKETGSKVEVDIVIEQSISGVPVTIGIECTKKKRKSTVEWYREMLKKHEDLPISKTVLVSYSGFTKDVYIKAKINNVELYSFKEALRHDWAKVANKLDNSSIVKRTFTPKLVKVFVDEEKVDKNKNLKYDLSSKVIDNGKSYDLGDYINSIIVSQGIADEVREKVGNTEKNAAANVVFDFPVPPDIIFYDGFRTKMLGFNARVEFESKKANFKFNSGSYLGKDIAYGECENIFNSNSENVLAVLQKDENDEFDFHITIPGVNDKLKPID